MRDMDDRRRFAKILRWPEVMAALLGDTWEVVAEGHPGRTAVFDDPIEGAHKNGLRCLQALLESHRPLDLVIVMLGTNDLKARFNATASDIALGLQRLVVEIRRCDSGPDGAAPQVLLAAPVPIVKPPRLPISLLAGPPNRKLCQHCCNRWPRTRVSVL